MRLAALPERKSHRQQKCAGECAGKCTSAAGRRLDRRLLRCSKRGHSGAEGGSKLAGRVKTGIGGFGKAAQNGGFDGFRQVGPVQAKRRRVGENLPVHDRKLGLRRAVGGTERRCSREREVRSGGEGIHITAGIYRVFAVNLFRACILNRAKDIAHYCQRDIVVNSCDPEIGQLRRTMLWDKNVRRLDVPVDNPDAVNAIKRRRDFFDNLRGAEGRQKTGTGDKRSKCLAGNVFHDQRRRVILCRIAGVKRVQGNNARVAQTQHNRRFAPEPAQRHGVLGCPLDFDNHRIAVRFVPAGINDGQRPTAKGGLTERDVWKNRHTVGVGFKAVAGNFVANERACFHKERSPKRR